MHTRTKLLLLMFAATAIVIGLVARTGDAGSASAHLTSAPASSTPDRPRSLRESFRRKLLAQGDVPTFFDNMVEAALEVRDGERTVSPAFKAEAEGVCSLFEQLLESKHDRFCSYEERADDLCPLTGAKSTLSPQAFILSQGTHSVVKWKGHDVFKTTFDLVLYWMIMDDIRPEVIVELGSGPGGSAIWFADMATALGFETHVYSYDIHKPDISHPDVTFVEFDLFELSRGTPLPFKERFSGTILVTEDAHVNVTDVLLEMDSLLSAGDYLIVEDSSVKQQDISGFLDRASRTYQLDRHYLDFFGKNGSSCQDSIFKVF